MDNKQKISEGLARLRNPVFTPGPPKPQRPPGRLIFKRDQHGPLNDSQIVRFRFRTRFIQATATPVNGIHLNVSRLRLQPSLVQTLLRAVVCRFPSFVQTWFDAWFPEWNLPAQLILKRQKEGWDEEFEAEKASYAKLRPVQGVFIPVCFGEVRCDNTRALLLSDIGGACLATPAGALLELSELRRLLQETLTALAQFRILQDDIKLDNFHLVGDKIMAVDLERVRDEYETDDLLEFDVRSITNWLAKLYEGNQYCFWEDGLIAVDKRDG